MNPDPPPVPPTLADIRCSFCHRRARRDRVVCGATPDIAICDECVELCAEIIAEQTAPGPPRPPAVA
jgi:hypothetical protein